MTVLSFYIKKFSTLKTAVIRGERAPHKPILLLAIIDGFEKSQIIENRIEITPELVASFKEHWSQLVSGNKFTPTFALPFYHLKSEKFWHIQTKPGRDILLTSSNSIKSFSHLKEVVNYVSLDVQLFDLMLEHGTRALLRQILLNTYFPAHKTPVYSDHLLSSIAKQILEESPTLYKRIALNFDEEEVFIRKGVFKKEIPRIYNYTCAISGLKIIATQNISMIDACHIIPFAESGDDTIGNGISLCPNLHRAFDRGLISIDNDYKVIIKPFFEESNCYSISQFKGKEMLLPKENQYRPLQENLFKHRERFHFI
jgi:putative restriction endonuclease